LRPGGLCAKFIIKIGWLEKQTSPPGPLSLKGEGEKLIFPGSSPLPSGRGGQGVRSARRAGAGFLFGALVAEPQAEAGLEGLLPVGGQAPVVRVGHFCETP